MTRVYTCFLDRINSNPEKVVFGSYETQQYGVKSLFFAKPVLHYEGLKRAGLLNFNVQTLDRPPVVQTL